MSSERLVYMNGVFVPEKDAKVSIFDSALMFGDMIFEMTRSFNRFCRKIGFIKSFFSSASFFLLQRGFLILVSENGGSLPIIVRTWAWNCPQ